MKITKILEAGKPTISFEVFPPKTTTAFDSVKAATERIAELHPAFMSVTYGAGGGTSQYTIEIAKNIDEAHGVPSIAHLTCVSSTRATVLDMIQKIKNAGISNVMALRGDIPEELKSCDRTDWTYHHAIDLIREIKQSGVELCIGGACYPEIHPESANRAQDIYYLAKKVDAGCDFLTTQMFFDNALFYSFLDDIMGAGISVPLIPGIMPITNAKQVERAINLSGCFMPPKFMELVDRYADDPVSMHEAGIEYATEQIRELYSHGVGNVHVYTMNKPEIAQKIRSNVSDIIDP